MLLCRYLSCLPFSSIAFSNITAIISKANKKDLPYSAKNHEPPLGSLGEIPGPEFYYALYWVSVESGMSIARSCFEIHRVEKKGTVSNSTEWMFDTAPITYSACLTSTYAATLQQLRTFPVARYVRFLHIQCTGNLLCLAQSCGLWCPDPAHPGWESPGPPHRSGPAGP